MHVRSEQIPYKYLFLSLAVAVAPWYLTPYFAVIVLIVLVLRFTPNRWGGGGYLKVHQQVGSLIDWYNVQAGILPSYVSELF